MDHVCVWCREFNTCATGEEECMCADMPKEYKVSQKAKMNMSSALGMMDLHRPCKHCDDTVKEFVDTEVLENDAVKTKNLVRKMFDFKQMKKCKAALRTCKCCCTTSMYVRPCLRLVFPRAESTI